MLHALSNGRILCISDTVAESVFETLKHYPDSLIITVTRRSASFINNLLVKNLFHQHPLAHVVADDENLISIHKGMRLILTRNVNKSIGFVNGQFVTVKCISSKTIIATHPNGHVINIFPMTTIVDEQTITKYPFLPGYARTILKVQGQTLKKVIVWLDTETTPEGTAYVALSQVKSLKDLHLLTPLNRTQFRPVS